MPALLPIQESSRELIVEVLRSLEPYFPDINARWRQQLELEFGFDGRVLSRLERISVATACAYFCHGDFSGYFENLNYFGTRLAKLQVDTRHVARALELHQEQIEPYLGTLFGDRRTEARAALEMVSSAAFVTVSGAYFDSKTQESNALLAVLDAELAAQNLNDLLHEVLEITTRSMDAAFGMILLRGENGESDLLTVRAAAGLRDEMWQDLAVPLGEGFAGRIAASCEPDISLDLSRDERILSRRFQQRSNSVWGVPLKNEGRAIGVLLIGFDKPYEWLPTERELMRAIADRSALAIERARMTDALRERETRIAELSGHLLRVQEEERKRISRELHDETGQALMVIRLYLGMLEGTLTTRTSKQKVRETLAVVDRTIEGIRRIIGRLSPLLLQELGLVAAIRKEAKDLAKNKGVKARVAIAEDVGRLDPEAEAAIYRIVQEALHNVAKHAKAKSVNIQMVRENGTVHLVVEDDGVGMASDAGKGGHSFGLAGIRERVAMLHGEVEVHSVEGDGTRLTVHIPAEPVRPNYAPAQVLPFASQNSAVLAASLEGEVNAKN